MKDVLIGRQPIYDADLWVEAYELLFRGAITDLSNPTQGDRATSDVLLGALTEIGLDRLVGERRAYINLTRNFVRGHFPLPAPPERVVVELLEDIGVDSEIIEGVRELKRAGFTIALDDFEFIEGCEPLLRMADIVKLDVLGLDDGEVARRFAEVQPFGVRCLAEKIETREQFELCRGLGFELFQGFFLARPDVVHERSVAPNEAVLLQLLSDVQKPDFSFERAEEIVGSDVALTYRLLRHINSAMFGLVREIDSVRETLVYLGLDNVKSMATLFLMSSIEGKPSDLISRAMFRAKMCQQLGKAASAPDFERFFTVGLLSMLDTLMDAPMPKLLEKLPLAEELHRALLGREGEMGEALTAAVAYERGDWDNVACFDLSTDQIREAFLMALDWVDEMEGALSGTA
jgi:EAL and modified HD-GYP domain-containing signal transduction protein